MKVVILLPHFGVYGGVRRFFEIGNVLTERFYDVVAYQTDYRIEHNKDWFKCNFPRKMFPYGKKVEADIVITGDSRRQKAFNQVKADKKYVYVINDLPEYVKQYKTFKHCQYILNNTGLMSEFPKSQLVIGGVNTNYFQTIKNRDWEARVLKILFFGRFDKDQKGSDYILKQLREATKFINIEYSCFDNVEHKRPVKIHNPNQEELVELYNNHHIFISWEKWGGWSNCAAEASACGCALVTNGVNCPWAVNNENAIVTNNIVSALRELNDNRESLRMLALEGWEKIQSYDWEKVCDKLELIFKQ